MEPFIFEALAGVAAQAAAAGGIRLFLAQFKDVVESTVRETCDQFPEAVADDALQRWMSDPAFDTFFERLQHGERDFGDELVESFIDIGEFYLPDDEDLKATAREILSAFLSALLKALLQSDQGILTLANRMEVLHSEGRLQADWGLATIDAKLATMQSSIDSMAMASEGGPPADPVHSVLATRIDLARDLFSSGNVTSARKALDLIKQEAEEIPDDLRFRLLTNLGGCALTVGDDEEGVTFLEEALRLQPDNPTAVANAAAAAGLQNQPQRAVELARHALELAPRDSHAAAVLMQSLWDAGEADRLDDFIAAEVWVLDERQCAQTLARIRTDQNRFDEAFEISRSLVESDPEDYEGRLALAACLLAAAHAGQCADAIASFREADEHAGRALALLETTELQPRLLQALSVRAGARLCLGDSEAAMNDLEAMLGYVEDDSTALYNKGQILLESDDFSGARAAFERISDSGMRARALVPHAAAALWSNDPATAADLLRGEFSLDSGGWDDIRKAELLCEVEAALGDEDSVGPLLDQALEQNPECPRLLGLAAFHHEIRDADNDAEQLFLRAIELSDTADRLELAWRFANFYGRKQRYADAADRYFEVVSGNVLHAAAIPLLGSLRGSGQLREALTWARQIRERHPHPPKLALETEAQILNHVGDVAAAAERWAEICSRDDATMFDRVQLAQALLWAGTRDAAREVIRDVDSAELLSDPQRLLTLAQLKLLLGVSGYLDDAYLARRHGLDDPSVHLGYFALFMTQDKSTVTPETVEPGCAVLLKSESTERWWVILDGGEEPRESNELAPEADLARELVGRQRGEVVLIQEGIEELSCEIGEIQTKYVRAFQTTVLEFPTRFPRNTALASVSVSGDDFSKFFSLVDEQDRFARRLHEVYRGGQVPFASLCARLGRPAPEVWRACTESGEVRIRFATGAASETGMAAELLNDADAIVLDTLALLTVHALDIADRLRERFCRIAVPQQALDEIQQLVHETTFGGQPGGYVGKNLDGSYAWTELSGKQWGEHQKFARSVLALAESFEPIASYPMLDVPPDGLETLAGVVTHAGVGAIYAGDQNPADRPLLVADDLGLSEIARALGVKAVNTQAVLLELRRSEMLADDEYSSLIARLARLNYRFVRVDAADILRLLEANGYITDEATRALLATIEDPECSDESAVSVTAGLISELARRGLPPQRETMLVTVLLGYLHRWRQASTALEDCAIEIGVQLQSTPQVRERIRALVLDYIQVVRG